MAGDTFEREAGDWKYRDEERAEVAGVMSCEVHGGPKMWRTESGLVVVDEQPVVVTDLKAAFLLAFAALGYRWALARNLIPVRRAIKKGQPAEMRNYWSGRLLAGDLTTAADQGVVLEVMRPHPCTIVRAADGVAVILPSVDSANVPRRLDGPVVARRYPWVNTSQQGHYVERVYRDGHLFHLDFCGKHV